MLDLLVQEVQLVQQDRMEVMVAAVVVIVEPQEVELVVEQVQ